MCLLRALAACVVLLTYDANHTNLCRFFAVSYAKASNLLTSMLLPLEITSKITLNCLIRSTWIPVIREELSGLAKNLDVLPSLVFPNPGFRISMVSLVSFTIFLSWAVLSCHCLVVIYMLNVIVTQRNEF